MATFGEPAPTKPASEDGGWRPGQPDRRRAPRHPRPATAAPHLEGDTAIGAERDRRRAQPYDFVVAWQVVDEG